MVDSRIGMPGLVLALSAVGMLDHAEPDYIYDRMGFRSVRPPVAPRREIQFNDTPKPMNRRKARRQRAQRKAKP